MKSLIFTFFIFFAPSLFAQVSWTEKVYNPGIDEMKRHTKMPNAKARRPDMSGLQSMTVSNVYILNGRRANVNKDARTGQTTRVIFDYNSKKIYHVDHSRKEYTEEPMIKPVSPNPRAQIAMATAETKMEPINLSFTGRHKTVDGRTCKEVIMSSTVDSKGKGLNVSMSSSGMYCSPLPKELASFNQIVKKFADENVPSAKVKPSNISAASDSVSAWVRDGFNIEAAMSRPIKLVTTKVNVSEKPFDKSVLEVPKNFTKVARLSIVRPQTNPNPSTPAKAPAVKKK
jgi:hypothetical protein